MLNLNTNLLSVSKLKDKGICVASRLGFLDLTYAGKTLATARRNRGIYVFKLGSENRPKVAFTAKANVIT
jgi:hypothetical protein